MAATHINAYERLTEAKVTALCNPSGRRLNGNFQKVGGNIGSQNSPSLNMKQVKAYQSYDEMLANPRIDLIDICAPTHAHPDLAIAALQAGKHVICEKPLARDSNQAARILRAAEKSKKFFMPAMCLRFWPGWSWLKELVEEETYGKPLAARFRRVAEPPTWGQKHFHDGKQSGGALLDLHIHDTDFVQFCFGKPRAVYSQGYYRFSGAIDHVVTQYVVDSNTIVHAEGSWAMAKGFGFSMAYTVNFEKATVDYDLARNANALRLSLDGKTPRTIKPKGDDGYVGELRYLAKCILTNKSPTVVTAADGLSAIQICEAEERSVRLGKLIAV